MQDDDISWLWLNLITSNIVSCSSSSIDYVGNHLDWAACSRWQRNWFVMIARNQFVQNAQSNFLQIHLLKSKMEIYVLFFFPSQQLCIFYDFPTMSGNLNFYSIFSSLNETCWTFFFYDSTLCFNRFSWVEIFSNLFYFVQFGARNWSSPESSSYLELDDNLL